MAVNLPINAPACFGSQQEWDEYRRLAKYSEGEQFSYCRDCTEAYQLTMRAAGRCEYPTVVFVKIEDIIVGLRQRRPSNAA